MSAVLRKLFGMKEKPTPNCIVCKWRCHSPIGLQCMAQGGLLGAIVHNNGECKKLYERDERYE